MKNVLFAVLMTLVSTPAFSAGGSVCYQLSNNGTQWSRTPELLCVAGPNSQSKFEITLERGVIRREVVATFELDNLSRARCLDCNGDVYGVKNPSNSIFNNLKISFDGMRNLRADTESGTLTIGDTKFFYRKN
jgi:hypothetical protein